MFSSVRTILLDAAAPMSDYTAGSWFWLPICVAAAAVVGVAALALLRHKRRKSRTNTADLPEDGKDKKQ